MSYTSLELMVQRDPDPLVAAVCQRFRRNSQIADHLQIGTESTLKMSNYLETGETEAAWRNMGEEHGNINISEPVEIMAGMYSLGGTILWDKMAEKDTSPKVIDPRVRKQQATVAAISNSFNDAFVNNTPVANPKAIPGLKHLLTRKDVPAANRVCMADNSNAPLDLRRSSPAYSTNCRYFIDMLDEMIASIEGDIGPKNCFFLCGLDTVTSIPRIFRDTNYLSTSQDSLGRTFNAYHDIPFIYAGRKADRSEVIHSHETYDGLNGTDGTDTASSVYLVCQGKENYYAAQMYPMEVKDWGQMPGSMLWKMTIDWAIGVMMTNPQSVSRGYGFRLK